LEIIWHKISRMITLYGIPQCDTVKKSRAWLDEHQLAYQFYDFKKQGVPQDALAQWIAALGWERLVNKKGMTWRKLDLAEQTAVVDSATATALMLRHASVIKRPVVVNTAAKAGDQTSVGFSPETWASWAAKPAKEC
jgi:arsenate reductase (glutaredoxin)